MGWSNIVNPLDIEMFEPIHRIGRIAEGDSE
jgi:hypothetical protein